MTSWGLGEWGLSAWGSGSDDIVIGPPNIIPLDPVDGDIAVAQRRPLTLRITDDSQVDFDRTTVIVNGVVWIQDGVAANGSTFEFAANEGNGYDYHITPPGPYALDTAQEVLVLAADDTAQTASLAYRFRVGLGLRLLQVRNPFENTLIAYFNRPLLIDPSFLDPSHWRVTAVSEGAAELEITEVSAREGRPDVAHLRYAGGGSTYQLRVIDIHGQEGEDLEENWDRAEFEIDYGDEVAPTVRLFNSVWGPLGISQRTRRRRKLDDFVANRSLSLALDEQFQLRLQRLDGTAGRDGRPGKRRT